MSGQQPLQESKSGGCMASSVDGRRCVLSVPHGAAHVWAKFEPVEVVPRSEAEALAEALETILKRHGGYKPMGSWVSPGHDVIDAEWDAAGEAVAAYRTRYPKEETP